ncbi:hypothetical protein GLAREA_06830 [Glarea lozoyensis ATCC 20868]|uniref:Uncharacterized protein n=1 Tax=Glarea lozoyensis (strain ATCC 20868 / MF5171) TaxID=1116229 RepID=S3D5V3_GLAL2|nr:uncharacterized protein GLAREA_06830 [Glarea lozoyensis ATCC 20868]EPE33817.1 hypothetical protein GLAREA_06830 [Glarea lozoyensis ATCC 20868]
MPNLPYNQLLACLSLDHSPMSLEEIVAVQALYDLYLAESLQSHKLGRPSTTRIPIMSVFKKSQSVNTMSCKEKAAEELAKEDLEYWRQVRDKSEVQYAKAFKEREESRVAFEKARRELERIGGGKTVST